MFCVVCYTTPARAVTQEPPRRSGFWSTQITNDRIQSKTVHQILHLLSIFFPHQGFFLFKIKLLLSIQLWLKIDWHLHWVPGRESPRASPLFLYLGALSAIKVDDSGATKGPTGAKGPVHGEGRKKNKQFIWEKRSSPLRPPLAATQKELDTAAI